MKKGQFLAYKVDTNYSPLGLTLVDTSFQNVVKGTERLKVRVVTAHLWWKQQTPFPFSISDRTFLGMVEKRVVFLSNPISFLVPISSWTSVNVLILFGLRLVITAIASQPKQVPQIGNTFPLLFSFVAQSSMQAMLLVQWFLTSIGISPPGNRTPFICGRRAANSASVLEQKIGMT